MKAVTEALVGQPPSQRTSYFGTRISGLDEYTDNPVNHGAKITVSYTHLPSVNDNRADYPADFTFWEVDCKLVHQQTLNYQFDLPMPCPLPLVPPICASYGLPLINIASGDSQWEAPELVRIRMDSASSYLDPLADISNENFRAGWIIQDECESGSLFMYPSTLPTASANPGYTVQLATSIPRGDFTPTYTKVGMGSHVGQNFPYAASEVVSDISWLEFAIALLDANGANGYLIDGNMVPAPVDLEVTFEFLNQSDWILQGNCINPPDPGTWAHYATEGDPDDFVIEIYDPAAPGGWSVKSPVGGETTITIPAGDTHARMRILGKDNDGFTATAEIAHMHIKEVKFDDSADYGILQIGWSSDFRFVIQEAANCPE